MCAAIIQYRVNSRTIVPSQQPLSPQFPSRASPNSKLDGMKVHSFQTLLGDLATIVKNRVRPKDAKIPAFDMLTTPTKLQQQAFDLLGVALRLN